MNTRLIVFATIMGLMLGILSPATMRAQDAQITALEMAQLPEPAPQGSVVIELYPQPVTTASQIVGEACYQWLLDDTTPAVTTSWDVHAWAGAHTNSLSWHDAAGDGASVTYTMWQDPNWGTATSGTVEWWRYEEPPVGPDGALVFDVLQNRTPSGWGWYQASGSIGETINLIRGQVTADRVAAFDGVQIYAYGRGRIVGFDSMLITKCYQPTVPTATSTATTTDTPLPTATPTATSTSTALPTATNTATNTPLPTSTPFPTVTDTPTALPTVTSTATAMPTATTQPTITVPVTTTQVGTISTTVEGCNIVYLPLIRKAGGYAEVQTASTTVTTTAMTAQCMAVPAALAAMCPTGWTYDWVVYNSDGTPELEFGRHLTCKGKPDLANAPILVTIMSDASMSVDPKSAIIAVLKALIPITVIAVWSEFNSDDTVGSNQFVVSNPVLVDEWFTGQLYDSPTGLYYGSTLRVDQYSPNGHVKYYSLPATWPATVRIVKAETSGISRDINNLALIQHKMDQEVYSFLVQTTAATDGELVTEVSGNAATIVNRVWREAIRANNAKMLAAPEKYFNLYQSWTASSQENGVNVELYLAAPSNSSNYVVIASDYAVVAGDRVLDQSLKLWGAIKIGGVGKNKSTAYSIFLVNEWYEYIDPSDPDYVATVQVPDFKYRSAFLPGVHTNLQELTESLTLVAASVLDRVDAAQTTALARVKSKREKCWDKGRYWDETTEKCLKARPVPDKPKQSPNEDKEPDMPDQEEKRYYPVVPYPAKDSNSWGHCRKTRGWAWCDDLNDVLTYHDSWWEFLGYTLLTGDPMDPGPRAAFVLHLDKMYEVGDDVLDKICVPYRYAEEPDGNGYWYITTAVPYVSDGGCLKPKTVPDSTVRLAPPAKP